MHYLIESFRQSGRLLRQPRVLAGAGLMIALNVVLGFVSVPISATLQITFTFLASGITGFLYGPWVAGLVGIVSDILKYFLHPTGPFFPGFTLNEFLLGVIFGLFFFGQPFKLWRVVCARTIATLIINLLLNPVWLSIMYGRAFILLQSERLVKNAIMLPIEITMLTLMLLAVQRIFAGRMAGTAQKEVPDAHPTDDSAGERP